MSLEKGTPIRQGLFARDLRTPLPPDLSGPGAPDGSLDGFATRPPGLACRRADPAPRDPAPAPARILLHDGTAPLGFHFTRVAVQRLVPPVQYVEPVQLRVQPLVQPLGGPLVELVQPEQ